MQAQIPAIITFIWEISLLWISPPKVVSPSWFFFSLTHQHVLCFTTKADSPPLSLALSLTEASREYWGDSLGQHAFLGNLFCDGEKRSWELRWRVDWRHYTEVREQQCNTFHYFTTVETAIDIYSILTFNFGIGIHVSGSWWKCREKAHRFDWVGNHHGGII